MNTTHPAVQLLIVNSEYQAKLRRMLNSIKYRRRQIARKTRMLSKEIQNLQEAVLKPKDLVKGFFSLCGIPYFKGLSAKSKNGKKFFMTPEPLEDINLARLLHFQPITEQIHLKLDDKTRANVIAIIEEKLVEMKRRQVSLCLVTEESNLLEDLISDCFSPVKRKNLKKEIRKYRGLLGNLDTGMYEKLKPILFNDASLHHQLSYADWLDVKREINKLDGMVGWTVESVQYYYEHQLRPYVKTGRFSPEERNVLKTIKETFDFEKGVDWELVAEELAVKTKSKERRRAFECFKYYRNCLEKDRNLHKRPWTTEEDLKLLNAYITSGVIDWIQLLRELPGRTKPVAVERLRYLRLRNAEEKKIVYGRGELQVIRKANELNLSPLLTSKILQERHSVGDIQELFRRLGRKEYWALRKKLEQEEQQPIYKKIGVIFENFGITERSVCDKKNMEKMPNLSKKIAEAIDRDAEAENRKNNKPKTRLGKRKAPIALEDQLELAVRPLQIITSRRQRVLSLPGDGRRHGLILAYLYTLLSGNFNLETAPSPDSDYDTLLEAGVAERDHSTYEVFMSLIHERCNKISKSEEDQSKDDLTFELTCLPPTLNTIAGLKGMLLYRKNLQKIIADSVVPVDNNNEVPSDCEIYEDEGILSLADETRELPVEKFGDPVADKELILMLRRLFTMSAVMISKLRDGSYTF